MMWNVDHFLVEDTRSEQQQHPNKCLRVIENDVVDYQRLVEFALICNTLL